MSDTFGNVEEVSLNGLLPGDYWLEIFGKNDDVSRGYNLKLQTIV